MQTGFKKVTVFVGSARKRGATSRAASQFVQNLESYGDVHGEIVYLSDYDIGVCTGENCTNWEEERCPLKDDRDVLIGKMTASDGVVFASPNYSFQVSAIMKIFLDRIGASLFHRPRFHGKTFTSIVVQAIGMGGKIVKYLEFVGGGLGFNVVKGSCSRTLEPMDQNALDRMERNLAKQSRRFHARSATGLPGAFAPRAHDVQDGPDGLSAGARREHARPRVFSRPGLVRIRLLLSRPSRPVQEGHRSPLRLDFGPHLPTAGVPSRRDEYGSRTALSGHPTPGDAGSFARPCGPVHGDAIVVVTRGRDERADPVSRIADDHAIVRKGLTVLLGTERDIKVVGEAKDGAEAVEKAAHRSRMWCSWTWSCPGWTASRPPAR